ncbi:MAG: DEAD/DEAH box helicase family protein [bacterium]
MDSANGAKSRTVIRRRKGQVPARIAIGEDGEKETRHRLESGTSDETITGRVRRAALRMRNSVQGSRVVDSTMRLRTEQVGVFEDIARYLEDHALIAGKDSFSTGSYGRIVQPPRTGKTVLIGETVAGSGATAVVIVPTTTLVDQAASDLRKHLPTVRVGVYYGEEKNLVRGGVIVTTYTIMQLRHKEGAVPKEIREATLVFLDEAHHSMTVDRQEMIEKAFHATAVRIALTATPDYDEQRTLAQFFPTLIHEITLQEAVELNLLSELKVWVVEVDSNASTVKLVSGDFDTDVLGEIMSTAPFFEACRMFRYDTEENARKPTLICCASRQQAYDCFKFLLEHRPARSKRPVLILSDTKTEMRRSYLEDFEAGRIDTIINVGVLIEGWNSPHCKLMVDMAPTVSLVRAKQKFFRVMTRHDSDIAMIYMLIPARLPQIPIFPQDLFGKSVEIHGFAELERKFARQAQKEELKRLQRRAKTPIEEVAAKTRVLLEASTGRHKLNPRDTEQIRKVIRTGVKRGHSLPFFSSFRHIWFKHDLFTGKGEQLMRFCGYIPNAREYTHFMQTLYPHDLVVTLHLRRDEDRPSDASCRYDVEHLLGAINSPEAQKPAARYGMPLGWRALGADEPPEAPEERLELKEKIDITMALVTTPWLLTEHQRMTLYMRYGLADGEECSWSEIGNALGIHTYRAEREHDLAVGRLSRMWFFLDRIYTWPDSPKAVTLAKIQQYYDSESENTYEDMMRPPWHRNYY